MPSAPIDQDLINDVLDNDPLLTPDEAAEALGISTLELEKHARDRRIASIQPVSPGLRRYRTSAVAAFRP
jgi:hypothetical protein